MKAIQNKRKLAANIIVPLGGGMIVAVLTRNEIQTKYEKLQTPAWTTFALGLNYSIWRMNKLNAR